MEFVAQRRAIRPIRRQSQLLHQHGDDLVARSIVRQFYRHAFILRRVEHRHVYVGHWSSVEIAKTARRLSIAACASALVRWLAGSWIAGPARSSKNPIRSRAAV